MFKKISSKMLRLFSILLIVAFAFTPVQVHAASLTTDGSWVVIGGEYNMGGSNKINEESRVRFIQYYSNGTAQIQVQLRTWATGGKRVNCTCGQPINGPWTYWTSDFDIYVNGNRAARIEPTDVKHYHGSGTYTESAYLTVKTGINLHIVVDPVNPWGPGYSSVASGGGEGNIDVTIPKQSITVSYNTNGGSPSSLGSQTVNAGDGFNLRSDVLSKTGYIHSGWNTNSSGTGVNYNLGQWTSFSSSITLYAKWTPITYTVRYNGNGNTGGSTASSSHTYGTAKNLTANGFTKTGYHFVGWATSSTGNVVYSNGQSVSNLTSTNGGTVDLYAKWAPNSYTVTYNGNGNTSGSTATSTHTYDTWKTLTPNGFHKTGYLFVNWNLNSAGTSTSYSNGQNVLNLTTVQNGNINLYAQWTPVKYKISFNGNGATSGSMPTIDATYDVSQNLPANQFKRTGYDFAGWNTKANGTGTAISNGGAAKNLTTTNGAEVVLYAQWNPIKYTVTLDANGGTYEGKSTHSVTVAYDSIYRFKEPERYGYQFKGWAISGTLGNYTWDKDEQIITQSPYTGTVYSGNYEVKNLRYEPGTVTFTARWTPCNYKVNYYELMHQVNSANMTYDNSVWLNGNPYSVAGVDEFGNYSWRQGYLIYNVGTGATYVKKNSNGAIITPSTSFSSPNSSLISVNGVYTNLVPQNKVSTSWLLPVQNNPYAGSVEYMNMLNYAAQKELWRKMVNGESYSLSETDVHIFAVFDDTVKPVKYTDNVYYVQGEVFNPKYEDGSIHYTNKDVSVKYTFYDGFSGIKTIRYMLGTSELRRWDYAAVNDVSQAEGVLTISGSEILTQLGPTTAEVTLTFANNISSLQNYYLEVTDYSGNVLKYPIIINCIDKTPPKLEDWIFQLCSGSITTSTNQPKKITASDTQSGVDYIEYVLSYTDEWGKPVQKKYRIEGSSGWMEVVPNPSNAVKIDIKVVDKATNVFETQNCQYTNYMEAESGVSLIDYNYLFGKYDEMFGRAEYDSDVTESNALEFIEALEQDTNDAAVSCLRWLQAKVKDGSTEAEALREFMDIYLYYRH